MELKYKLAKEKGYTNYSSNRTFMELKYVFNPLRSIAFLDLYGIEIFVHIFIFLLL